LKGILLDSASINSRGSEIPTSLRKYDYDLSSMGIKSSVIEPIRKRQRKKSKVGIEKEIPNEP
jgi:hypothetical protein